MAPLYKKNDRADIANYRPISLLNTDYKIMTNAIALRLAKTAPTLIHPDQAGFIPGRHIHDQIWLTKRIIEMADLQDQNGAIILLDQEKAYDKIEHDYLWRIMESYNFPQETIKTIKSLYTKAMTFTYINGVKSETPYEVTRGVRQGDPLSCILFDLAIDRSVTESPAFAGMMSALWTSICRCMCFFVSHLAVLDGSIGSTRPDIALAIERAIYEAVSSSTMKHFAFLVEQRAIARALVPNLFFCLMSLFCSTRSRAARIPCLYDASGLMPDSPLSVSESPANSRVPLYGV